MGLGPVEGEDLPAARLWVEEVGELRLLAGRLVEEGQRADTGHAWPGPGGVLAGLRLDAVKASSPPWLGLERPDRAVDVEHIVDSGRGP